jgi:hypothetical protein
MWQIFGKIRTISELNLDIAAHKYWMKARETDFAFNYILLICIPFF